MISPTKPLDKILTDLALGGQRFFFEHCHVANQIEGVWLVEQDTSKSFASGQTGDLVVGQKVKYH